MAASAELGRKFNELTINNPNHPDSTDVDAASDALIRRTESGGMVIVNQDIYLQNPIGKQMADIVLPAATWGEHDFTRANGERRLRLYSKFTDPPGNAKADWWIISRFAQKMGFSGYDWEDSNQVFEESARFGRNELLNYHPLVWLAKKEGRRAHELLRDLGTTGIQLPIRWFENMPAYEQDYIEYVGSYKTQANGAIIGTKRLHDSMLDLGQPQGPTVHKKWYTHFKTQSGKAVFSKSPWEWFSDFFERITPTGDELWVTNGRVNELWQSMFDDSRKPYIMQRWPSNHVEIHPDDAARYGIESGDEVIIESDDILIQTGGWSLVKGDEFLFAKLDEKGLIKTGKGSCKAVAFVTDAVRPGVLFTDFLWALGWPETEANSLVHRVPDPITNRYRFKLGKGKIRKIGESPWKNSFAKMTFAPRTII